MAGNLTNINADAPDFVRDIKSKHSPIPLDMDMEYIPQNPYTMNGNEISHSSNNDIEGLKENSSFLDTAKEEFKSFNTPYQAAHALNMGEDYKSKKIFQTSALGLGGTTEIDNPNLDIPPPDWNPKSDSSKFVNIQPENMKYLLDATGPKDQDYRLQKVLEEQAHNETLANGSWFAKLVGGAAGIVTDPTNLIPIAGWAKYAKLAPSFFKSAARALPGVAASSILQAGAEQADKVNGNMVSFVEDSFIRTAFGSILFGGLGAIGHFTDRMELWNLRNLAKPYIQGGDFKLATDESGKITGFKVHNPDGALSAQQVSFAQDLANSSFSKSGLFKVPYLGEAATRFLGMPILGTPLVKLINSPFKTVRGFIDRVADHSFVTTGIEQGEAAPKKFASLMNQTFGSIRTMAAQVDALHLERNGIDIKNRPLGGLVNLGLNLKEKALQVFASDLDKTGYVSKEDFHSEIENVLFREESSKHAAVNEAAAMLRKQMDTTYEQYRAAYNLPKDWMPPRTAAGYLTRVYDTNFLNNNEDKWVDAISGWLKEADETISQRMEPINTLNNTIKDFETKHTQAVHILANLESKRIPANEELAGIEHGVTIHEGEENNLPVSHTSELKPGSPEHTLKNMRIKLRSLKDILQNELRSNPDLQIHVDDINALSANEAKELEATLKPSQELEKQVTAQKKVLSEVKTKSTQKLSRTKGESKLEKAIPKSKEFVASKEDVKAEEDKLREIQDKLDIEKDRLQELAHKGEINPRFYNKSKDSFYYEFKDPNNRLKFRETFPEGSFENPNVHRQVAAKAYYDTIMNQTPEDTINQIMGRVHGNQRENPIKQRTLLIPDDVLYKNKFMSKDLIAKVSNYTTYLARRTHLKSVFNDVTTEGGIESLLGELNKEHEQFRTPLNTKKSDLEEKLKQENLSSKDKKKLEKELSKVDKQLEKTRKDFNQAKQQMNHIFEKMMGIRKEDKNASNVRSIVMSLTAMANLPFVPFTMINDLGAVGLQHGIWPFIRDGVYPIIESLGGILKTKESEAFRNSAGSIHLGMQDVLNGYSDKNNGGLNQPYFNMGKWVGAAEKLAHFSANFTLTNYIDNGLQRMTASIIQSELMRILHAFKNRTMSKRDGIYIRKYGIDPKIWADRMIDAFKQGGGSKTRLGGYQSMFYHWQDLEAANKFGSAVFRGVKDTQIQRGIADSPLWADNPIGAIVHGFSGWAYASVNRYVIPSMQQPDAQKFLGVLFMLGTGAMVSPMRRMARGESPYPDNATDKQILWQTIQDSGYFSAFANVLEDANILTGDRLLGDLRNDRYGDRTRAGLLGPSWGTVNRMADIIGALGSNEMNEKDALKMARMMPIANASWTFLMSKKLIEGLGLPKNRAQAHALKEINQ